MNFFKKRYFSVIIVLIISVLIAAGCSQEDVSGSSEESDVNDKIKVYTSLYPLFDFASKIAGDRAEVINLVPPGGEPHDFEPTPKDIVKLSEGDLFIYNGGGFELWIEKVLDAVDTSNMTVINASEYVELLTPEETGIEEFGDDHGHGVDEEDEHAEESNEEDEHGNEDGETHNEEGQEAVDPHYLLDPIRAKDVAKAIKDSFISLDPSGQEIYEQNYDTLITELDKIHAEYENAIKNVERKDVIVSHDAYGYLMKRYGLNQIPITGITQSDEPSPKELQEIITFVKDNNIKYIMFETLVSVKIAEMVKEQVGAEALTLNPISGLTKQELDDGKDYFSVMRENLESLKIALGSE